MFARLLPATALLAVACSFIACAPKAEPTDGTLFAVQNPTGSLKTDGSTVNLKWTVLDTEGKPGTGDITFAANIGAFGNGQNTVTMPLSADGTAAVDYGCNAATSSNCIAQAEINATWKNVRTLLFVTLTAAPDAGH